MLLVRLDITSWRISLKYFSTCQKQTRYNYNNKSLKLQCPQFLLSNVIHDWVIIIISYNGFICDKSIPDASHGLPDCQVGVKLVSIEAGNQLRQERSQLLTSLSCNYVKSKCSPLQHRKSQSLHAIEKRLWKWLKLPSYKQSHSG